MFRFFILFSLMVITVSCGGKEIKSGPEILIKNDSISLVNNSANSQNEVVTEIGLVKEVEDSGYPFATLTIEFPERKFSAYFTINMEEVEYASLDIIRQFVGKYVTFRYTSELIYALLDIHMDNKSLLGMDSAPDGKDIKIIEGILDGATEETPGDLPGEISIWAKDGENLDFDFFVTSEMVAANGKKVKGYYDTRTKNTLRSISLSGK